MRVLCVGNRYPPWSVGGYERVWQDSVWALRARGHEVRVLTTAPDPSDLATGEAPDPDVHRDLRWYWREHRFPRLSLRECLALERANRETLARHLGQFRPDVVSWWAMGGMSLSLLEQVRRAGVPALGVVADDWMSYGPKVDRWSRRWPGPLAPPARAVAGVPARIDLTRAARWLFISEHLRDVAPSRVRERGHTAVLHPGVDGRRFAFSQPGPWGWRLLYCGRIDPRKGIATAITALTGLPPEATLVIDGDGDRAHAEELRVLAGQLRVDERVQFRRTPPAQVPDAYADADALVFPVTWTEPWGLVPLEAMATGRPVIASRAGGGPDEYLEDGANCLRFEPGEADGLAAAALRLAADPELRRGLVAAGRVTAAQLSTERFHAGLEQELARVAAR